MDLVLVIDDRCNRARRPDLIGQRIHMYAPCLQGLNVTECVLPDVGYLCAEFELIMAQAAIRLKQSITGIQRIGEKVFE